MTRTAPPIRVTSWPSSSTCCARCNRTLIIWGNAPIHHSPLIKAFLANGAAQRLDLERLQAYAPDLNPDEGVWQQLKGVELRNPCRVDLPHLRRYCIMPSNESGGSHISSKAASRGWTSTRYAPISNSSCQGESAAQSLLVGPAAYSRISGWNLNSAGSRRSTVPRTQWRSGEPKFSTRVKLVSRDRR